MDTTSSLALVSSTSVGENFMVKGSSQPGAIMPLWFPKEQYPASILPVSALTILQLYRRLMRLMFFRVNLCTLLVYIRVGKKLIDLDSISQRVQSATAEHFRLIVLSVLSIGELSGQATGYCISMSASSPAGGTGGLSSFFSSALPAFLVYFFPPFLAASAYYSRLRFSSYFLRSSQSNSVLVTNLVTDCESSQSTNSAAFCLI